MRHSAIDDAAFVPISGKFKLKRKKKTIICVLDSISMRIRSVAFHCVDVTYEMTQACIAAFNDWNMVGHEF